MTDRPKWITDAKDNYYDGRETLSLETHLQRSTRLLNVLRDGVLPSLTPHKPASILDVGVGLDAHLIKCPYEPYRLAALLESEGRDYRMGIVDKDNDSLADLAARREIFLLQTATGPLFSPKEQQEELAAWKEYLDHTRQNERLIHEPAVGLHLVDWLKDKERMTFFERGIRTARVPAGFRQKLEAGQIPLINGDIAKVDLNAAGHYPYDLVVAQMVFPYLKEEGQKLALFNLVQATEIGGYIVIDNLKLIMPWMSFLFEQQHGGWLNEVKLAELDLRIVHKLPITDTYDFYVLQKS